MQHHRTRGLWSVLCSHKIELLPPSSHKWNYYLQGAEVIIHNDHMAVARFLNGKNANNKVNRWGLELAMYNLTFKWISGAQNKPAACPDW